MAYFRQNSTLDALIGSYDDEPGQPGFLAQYRNLLHHYTHQTASEQAGTFWGACGAIRAEVFHEMGGFNPALRYLEDVELGMRMRREGRRIHLAKQWRIKHWKDYSPYAVIHNDLIQRALPWTRLALSGHGLINDLNTKTGKRFSVGLSLLLPVLTAAGIWAPTGIWAPAGIWAPWIWLACGAAVGLFIYLDRDFYRFLARTKGLPFTAGVVPWQWMHYTVSGIGLVLGLIEKCSDLISARNQKNIPDRA